MSDQENQQAESQSPVTDEVQALKDQLAQSQAKSQENLEGWQRSLADFSNYKKRVERDNEQLAQILRGNVIKRYLAVVDDLERALANRPADDQWADGVELIYRKLTGILEAEGVVRIQAEGQPFDPNFHEAIMQEETSEHASGTVIAVLQHGYMIGDKVLRPAMVKVAA
jgi:molecular chaperone GrpE